MNDVYFFMNLMSGTGHRGRRHTVLLTIQEFAVKGETRLPQLSQRVVAVKIVIATSAVVQMASAPIVQCKACDCDGLPVAVKIAGVPAAPLRKRAKRTQTAAAKKSRQWQESRPAR